jgi:integrase
VTPAKRRTKGDGSLFKRADGQWVGVVELEVRDGKRRQKRVSSKDRNVAIAKLKKLRSEVEAGRVAVTDKATVQAWLERWIEDIHGPKLRPGVKDDYARTIRLHITPHIGTRRLSQLTPEHVRQMHKAIESSRTAQLAHIILSRALKDAEREGMIARNVAEIADKPRHTTEHRQPLTAEQAMQLIKSLDSKDPMSTRWAAALFLGARQGEILGLQWSRLDLERGIADFAWQLQHVKQAHGCGERHSDGTYPCGRQRVGYCPQRKWDLPRGFEHQVLYKSLVLSRPKTEAGTRIVPIPAPLWTMLERQPREGQHDLVWYAPAGRRAEGGRPIHPRDDYDAWQAALKHAGLPPAPLHVARNTTATLLMEAGVPEQIRMAILGHVSITAQRAYAHVDVSLARQHMAALDRLAE